MKKGASVLRDKRARELRALMMLEFKIRHAATTPEIAKEFGVSHNTVERALSLAKQANLIAKLEDKVINELMPAAHDAVLSALKDDENKIEAGKLGVRLLELTMPSMKKQTAAKSEGSGDELADYIARIRVTEAENDKILDGVVEGTVVGALPPAETSAAPQGDAESARGDAARNEPDAPEPPSVG